MFRAPGNIPKLGDLALAPRESSCALHPASTRQARHREVRRCLGDLREASEPRQLTEPTFYRDSYWLVRVSSHPSRLSISTRRAFTTHESQGIEGGGIDHARERRFGAVLTAGPPKHVAVHLILREARAPPCDAPPGLLYSPRGGCLFVGALRDLLVSMHGYTYLLSCALSQQTCQLVYVPALFAGHGLQREVVDEQHVDGGEVITASRERSNAVFPFGGSCESLTLPPRNLFPFCSPSHKAHPADGEERCPGLFSLSQPLRCVPRRHPSGGVSFLRLLTPERPRRQGREPDRLKAVQIFYAGLR